MKMLKAVSILRARDSTFEITSPLSTVLPITLSPNDECNVLLQIKSVQNGKFKSIMVCQFDSFSIHRFITVTCGDSVLHEVLKSDHSYNKSMLFRGDIIRKHRELKYKNVVKFPKDASIPGLNDFDEVDDEPIEGVEQGDGYDDNEEDSENESTDNNQYIYFPPDTYEISHDFKTYGCTIKNQTLITLLQREYHSIENAYISSIDKDFSAYYNLFKKLLWLEEIELQKRIIESAIHNVKVSYIFPERNVSNKSHTVTLLLKVPVSKHDELMMYVEKIIRGDFILFQPHSNAEKYQGAVKSIRHQDYMGHNGNQSMSQDGNYKSSSSKLINSDESYFIVAKFDYSILSSLRGNYNNVLGSVYLELNRSNLRVMHQASEHASLLSDPRIYYPRIEYLSTSIQTHSTNNLIYNEKLNPQQIQAIRNILDGTSKPLPYIIYGPPGTGKVSTICIWIICHYSH
jgi:hypothetical protein